jgi:acetyl esterase
VTLDPQARSLLDRMAAFDEALPPPPPDEREAVIAARDGFSRQSYELMGAAETMGSIRDAEARGPGGPLRVRVYTPALPLPQGTRRPGIAFAHGGGWVEGSLDSHDRLCRALCNGTGAVVAAIDYRLAPEHPFPAAVEDCVAGALWLHDRGAELDVDARRLALAGDSAGGNLMAVAARRLRDDDGPELRLQALLYPATDATMACPSYLELDGDYGLSADAMRRSWHMYLDGHDPSDPDASPLHAEDLSGLPPALVLTCEYDPLRDEGERYAERLREAGVPATLIRWPGQAHGFVRWRGAIDAAHVALDEVCQALSTALAEPAPAPS